MNLILFDDYTRIGLLPLTFTRPVADLRCGILTIREKWERHMGAANSSSIVGAGYLADKFPMVAANDNWLVSGSVFPTPQLVNTLKTLTPGQWLADANGQLLGGRADAETLREQAATIANASSANLATVLYGGEVMRLEHTHDIFSLNGKAIEADFELLTAGRSSAPISSTNTLIGDRVFLEPGARVEAAVLNSNTGPIYIGKDAEIMEGSLVRGPLAMCEGSALKLGSKIYGPTTLGPHSKVGGEVNNSVLIGYSNKGHDGFLGNSVLGEWCNIGADSNNSNLKNNYAEVKLWSYQTGRFAPTGLQFCGLIMGDHSKCGINTMFNTGTVVGVSCNIYGAGFPRNFVPSFSWGGAQGMIAYKVEKTFEVAEKVMSRRNIPFTEQDRALLTAVFEATAQYRNF